MAGDWAFPPPPPPPPATMSITKAYCSIDLFWVPKVLTFKTRLSKKPCESEFYICMKIKNIIIPCKFSFLSLAKIPPHGCKKLPTIMVCSCAMSSNFVWLQIIIFLLMHKGNHAFLLLAITLAWKWQKSLRFLKISIKKQTRWLNDKTIKKLLLSSVIAKYHDLSVSHRSIICLSLRLTNYNILLNLIQ